MADSIILADGDDWEGLYFNGVLITEGHRVTIKDVVMVIQNVESANFSYEEKEADSKWLADEGSFPMSIEDVRWTNG